VRTGWGGGEFVEVTGWICSIFVEGGWFSFGGGWICYFHPLPFSNLSTSPTYFSVSPTCICHLHVDFTYLGMPLGMLLCRSLGQFLGSYVVNQPDDHHMLSPGIEGYSTSKKERTKGLLADFMNLHLCCVIISVVCVCLLVIFSHGFLSPQKPIFTKRLLDGRQS